MRLTLTNLREKSKPLILSLWTSSVPNAKLSTLFSLIHKMLFSAKSKYFWSVIIQFCNHNFIVAVTFSASQEAEKENSILVPPGEEKETERAEHPVFIWQYQ
jgi:hypothetical protein